MGDHLLIADDDVRVLETFSRNLERLGYTVVKALGGEEAVRLYAHGQPAIALIDVRMPGMDGFDVLKAIRSGDPEAEVILVTGHGDVDTAVEALRLGASDFLAKPVEQSALDIALRRAQDRIRLKRSLRRAQAALQASEAHYRAITEAAVVGVGITDVEENLTFVNQAFADMLGYERTEMWFMNLAQLTTPEEFVRYRQETQSWMAGLRSQYETVMRRRDGSMLHVLVSAAPITDAEGEMRILAVISDITDLKNAERERERYAAELERSNKELQQFAYIASHDLREPLRMVSGFVDLLARRYRGRLDDEADEFIAYIVDGVARMQRLISDLLAYSRAGKRDDRLALSDCNALVEQALLNLHAVVAESEAVVTHDPLPTLVVDPSQIVQVFQNLISNGIKFQPPQPVEPPRVHISAEQGGGIWTFSVQDNGIGIAPEDIERVFEVFERLHTQEEYPGTGIGLSICKKVAENHGGRIWATSELGRGSTFFFTIPE
ncbi:MAG: response regulator [Anaerolineae bacterium]|nr:response regulator [Anaerolineae bacterium]